MTATMNTGYEVDVTPESAGWAYTSLRVVELPAAGEHRVATGADELIVVPLSGAVRVSVGDGHFDLAGRTDVFAGPTDVGYVGRDAEVVLTSPDGRPPVARGSVRGGRRPAPA